MVHVAALAVGAVLQAGVVWSLADAYNGLMAVPNLIAVVLLMGQVKTQLRRYLARQ